MMTTASTKPWVRGGGQVLALALIAYLLWAWAMGRPTGAESATIADAPAQPAPPTRPSAPEPAALAVAELPDELAAEPAAPAAPASPERPSAEEIREQAQDVRLTVEEEGDFGAMYEKWRSEPEDNDATHAAMQWVEQRLLAIDLVPDASFLSCKQSLCRLGLGFEQMKELQRLNKIEIPPGLDPKISETFEFREMNMTALVIYWDKGKLPAPSPVQ
ncbi:MAG TPA: hypothetical protein VK509_17810 [Polyangiales bacterium]|nr:hypothetical protein [Polyangiales bacterium]